MTSEPKSSRTMELTEFTKPSASSRREVQKLRAKVGQLERQWKEKETELIQLRQETNNETERLQEELASLRATYEEKMKVYKDLFHLKTKLDQELETYRLLLKGEENRLHNKLHKRPAPQGGTPSPVRPRPQVEKQTVNEANISSTATGYVQIISVDPKGKYVQIKNMADQPESVGGFKLVHVVAETGQEDIFVFHARSQFKRGSTTTVWSKLSGEERQPPTDIVSKQIDMWGVGRETTTKLFTSKGELIATYIQRQQVSSSITYSSTPKGQMRAEASNVPGPSQVTVDGEESEGEGEEVRVGTEELYHQETTAVEKKNRSCVIS